MRAYVRGERFPSETCLGEWRKNELKKSAQHMTEEARNIPVSVRYNTHCITGTYSSLVPRYQVPYNWLSWVQIFCTLKY